MKNILKTFADAFVIILAFGVLVLELGGIALGVTRAVAFLLPIITRWFC